MTQEQKNQLKAIYELLGTELTQVCLKRRAEVQSIIEQATLNLWRQVQLDLIAEVSNTQHSLSYSTKKSRSMLTKKEQDHLEWFDYELDKLAQIIYLFEDNISFMPEFLFTYDGKIFKWID